MWGKYKKFVFVYFITTISVGSVFAQSEASLSLKIYCSTASIFGNKPAKCASVNEVKVAPVLPTPTTNINTIPTPQTSLPSASNIINNVRPSIQAISQNPIVENIKYVYVPGPAGPKGEKGDRGDMGPAGSIGISSNTGWGGNVAISGAVGPVGPAGPAGITTHEYVYSTSTIDVATGTVGILNSYDIGTILSQSLLFRTNNIVRMTVTDNGYVGIGTTTPQYKLDILNGDINVQSTSAVTRYINIIDTSATSTGNGGASVIKASANYGGAIALVGNASSGTVEGVGPNLSGISSAWRDLVIATAGGGSALERLRITTAGNIGIGTTTPTHRLYVRDTSTNNVARFEGVSSAQCTVVAGTGWSCTSDEKLKDNILDFDNTEILERLSQIRTVNYNWKNGDGYKQYGVLAQNVESVFPTLVMTDTDGTKSVRYGEFTPLMISALKALDAKVNALSGVSNSQNIQNANAQSLCIGETCVNEDQLKQILKLINTSTEPEKAQEVVPEIAPDVTASSTEM